MITPGAERPRDRLGRPLPWDATGYPTVPIRADISAEDAIAEARAYLDEGLPFHAHEVLEMRWRCCPPDERDLWRALAQAAAAVTHEARGNPVGAQRLHERASATLSTYAGRLPASLDPLLIDLSLTPPAS